MSFYQISLTARDIPENLESDCSIVIDVLRASSVMITALAQGACCILPAASVDEALELKKKYPHALLSGERNAQRIDGFDRGNSPFEHLQNEAEKPLIMSTTNGTRALKAVQQSGTILIGGFINVDAVCDYIRKASFQTLHLACAGTHGAFSLDDFLMAGALVYRLADWRKPDHDLALAACQLYEKHRGDLQAGLAGSTHFQTLKRLGFERDLAYCLTENSHEIVPRVSESDPMKVVIDQKE